MDIEKTSKNLCKAIEETGEAMSQFTKLQKEWYQKSFWFRCWVRWDNFIFFFKRDLPNYVRYVIYRIKHPKHSFMTWRR